MNATTLAPFRPVLNGETPKDGREHICVVVVTYNSGDVIGGLLDSVATGLVGVDSYDVIVVDNESRDGSADLAAAHPVRPRVIRTGSNAGYAAGINAATRVAPPDAHLLILNPDLRLLEGSGMWLLAALRGTEAGIAIPRNLKADGTLDPTLRREPSVHSAWCEALLGGKAAATLGLGEVVADGSRYDRTGPVEWATASALLIAPRARQAVGEWDESFFLYSEEVDYQRRVRQAGFEIVYVPSARVMHIGGEYRVNPRLYALLTSNRIRYFARHHDRISTLAFRLGVATGEMLRCWHGPVHRWALACALSPLKPALHFRADGPSTTG